MARASASLIALSALALAAFVAAVPALSNSCVKRASEPVAVIAPGAESTFDFDSAPLSIKRGGWSSTTTGSEAAPLVTVITRTSRADLDATAATLQSQSLAAWRWVIVNEASMDLSKYTRDARVSVVDSVEVPTTPYAMVLGEGDLLEKAYLERLVWVLETNPQFHYANTYSVANGATSTGTFYDDILETNDIPLTAVLRSSVAGVILNAEAADAWTVWAKLKASGHHGITVPEFMLWTTTADQAGVEVEDFPELKDHTNPVLSASTGSEPSKAMDTRVQSACEKRALVVLPWMGDGAQDISNAKVVENLAAQGWQVTIAATLDSPEADHVQPIMQQYTEDIHVMPRFVRTQDFGKFLVRLAKTRDVQVIMVASSYAGYNLLPYLAAFVPEVALVDLVHERQEYYAPAAFFEDAAKASNGGYAQFSALFSQYLDASVYTSEADKSWVNQRQSTYADSDDAASEFFNPTVSYRTPDRFVLEDDNIVPAFEAALAQSKSHITSAEVQKEAIAALAAVTDAILDNDGSMGSFVDLMNGKRFEVVALEEYGLDFRRTDNNSSGNGTSGNSTYSSAITITQVVNFAASQLTSDTTAASIWAQSAGSGDTASDAYNKAVGAAYGTYVISTETWASGCSTTNSGLQYTGSRRGTGSCTFTSSVSSSLANTAAAAAQSLSASVLNSKIAEYNSKYGTSLSTNAVASVQPPTIATVSTSGSSSDGLAGGAIAGIVIGCIVGALCIGFICYYALAGNARHEPTDRGQGAVSIHKDGDHESLGGSPPTMGASSSGPENEKVISEATVRL